MKKNSSYQSLVRHFTKIRNLQHLGAIASWDEAVMMPQGAGEYRAEAMAELHVLLNDLLCDPRLPEWLAEAQQAASPSDSWKAANLREMAREVSQATAVDSALVEAKTKASMRCEQTWRIKRAQNDWTGMKPLFQEVVRLARLEAQQRAAHSGLKPYDAMMDLHEPGMRSDQVDQLFFDLKNFLPDFIQRVLARQRSEGVLRPDGPFPIPQQRQLGLKAMEVLGFDFRHGRLDVSHHPFCGGVPHDVRITTRYQEHDFADNLMSVLHETGHALYEQGLPREWTHQPVSSARSMGIHESQSLLFEMQVGRSFHFLQYLSPIMKDLLHLGPNEQAWSPEHLYRSLTRVKPDFIRVNADEVTYPAHVILRYEIERPLIEGRLEVEDIPEVWNQKMQQYLGLSTVGNFKDGPLQDVHWMGGTFGYFPSYTLGAMNAAQIFQAVYRDCPGLLDDFVRGDLSRLRRWLGERIWSRGSFLEVNELLRQATGEVLNPKYFKQHLSYRYLERDWTQV